MTLADRYQLVAHVGEGSCSEVWRALDLVESKEVALKFGPAQQLQAEYQFLRSHRHPVLVHALADQTGESPAFIVLEWIEGDELRQMMGADRRRWLPILRQVVDALASIHKAGVAHGDVSLQNIIIGVDGRARLLDPYSRQDASDKHDARALGAVIYQLVTGRTFADQLEPGDLEPELHGLINRLRGPRPVDMHEITVAIDELLRSETVVDKNFEKVTPLQRQSVGETGVEVSRSFVPWKVLATVAMVVFSLLGLVIVAPQWLADRPASDNAAGPASATEDVAGRMARQQQQFDQKRAGVYQKWLQLESIDVHRWAELRAARALELLEKTERLAGDFELLSGLNELEKLEQMLDALIEEAPAIAEFHRAAGWQAFRAGDADTAASHFQAVLAIEPESTEIRAALAQTPHLGQLVQLRQRSRQQEEAGNLDAALQTLHEAAQLDDDNADVAEAIEELEQKIVEHRFQSLMSDFYSELNAGAFSKAKSALERARQLRPGTPAVSDAALQLELRAKDAGIARLRQQAQTAEREQRWDDAIASYSELLQLDPALLVAQQGRDRARRIASLQARTEALLAGELTDDKLRTQARQLIDQVAGVEANAPALKALAADLETALQLSTQPVVVHLRSDNKTDVTVYRVGSLGRFTEEQLELQPGNYTVVGTRDGFRDVRMTLVVRPGESPPPVVISCKEAI